MNRQSVTTILEALYDAAGDEAIIAIFDYIGVLVYFQMSSEAWDHVYKRSLEVRQHIEGRVDSWIDKAAK